MKSRKFAHGYSLVGTVKTHVLLALSFVLAVLLFVSTVCADPVPAVPRIPTSWDWLIYTIEVITGETIAWIIGAELLWRLTTRIMRDRQEEICRSDVYKIMLLAMLLSFFIGLAFWKIFGWI